MAHPLATRGFRTTWLYRLLLSGPGLRGHIAPIPELWPGDPEVGKALLAGQFEYGPESHTVVSAATLPPHASSVWLESFHGLDWLTHLRALSGGQNGGEAPYFAREWLSTWMDAHTHYSEPAWTPSVTARRIINVLKAWAFLVRDDAAGPFEKMLRTTLARDLRHLHKTLPVEGSGYERLLALKALTFASLSVTNRERSQSKTLRQLEAEIDFQVLPDGGHIERNPERLADVLGDVLEIKALLVSATGEIPSFVQNAIDRAAPMLRMLRHPDGRLAVFNGGLEGCSAHLDRLLSLTEGGAKAPSRAPYAGFQRLGAGNLAVIMDCGRPGGPGHLHHAGTLSFEMSVGAQRVIVNCGARTGREDPWRAALSATAAHSTLTVNDTSSAAFALDGTVHRGPDHVSCERSDSADGVLVESEHDGYLNAFGLRHRRALYVGPGGDDMRGEDRLSGRGGEYFTIRFHLHPGVKASVLGEGAGALLRFGHRGRETWRLRASMGELKLEPSVYLGRPGEQRRTEQIVISGPLTGNGALVKWALTKESP